jgi:cell wall-associated NlpC family hydrolase
MTRGSRRIRHAPRRRLAAVAAALMVGCGTALAAPEAPADAAPDPVAAWLVERGLVPAAEHPTLIGTMRDRAAEAVIAAMNFLGVRYRRGGNNADEGFDCSGFTRHIFALSLGLVLPRRVDDQAGAGGLVDVARNELQPGDLVFFNTLKRTFSHVGIYVGGGKFIHSPRSGSEVRIEDMRYAYWAQRFTGARRAAAGLASTRDESPLPGGGS